MQTQGERANITQETIMVRDSKNNLASQNRTHNYLYIYIIIGVYLTNKQGLRLISTPSNTEAEAASGRH